MFAKWWQLIYLAPNAFRLCTCETKKKCSRITNANNQKMAKKNSDSRKTKCCEIIIDVTTYHLFRVYFPSLWICCVLVFAPAFARISAKQTKNSDEELSDLTDGIRPMKFRNEHVHGAPFKSNSSVESCKTAITVPCFFLFFARLPFSFIYQFIMCWACDTSTHCSMFLFNRSFHFGKCQIASDKGKSQISKLSGEEKKTVKIDSFCTWRKDNKKRKNVARNGYTITIANIEWWETTFRLKWIFHIGLSSSLDQSISKFFVKFVWFRKSKRRKKQRWTHS